MKVCAGIITGRVRIWHYLEGTWNKDVAEKLYREAIAPALRKYCGRKRAYTILEDNDPTGYKSKSAISAKAELGIKPIQFPTYSPDLNPCDFALWSEVEGRMAKMKPKAETLDEWKARLRRTAMAIPEPTIRKMLGSIKKRAESIYQSNGGHIPRD